MAKRGSSASMESQQNRATGFGTGTLDPLGLPTDIVSGPRSQYAGRGTYPIGMSRGEPSCIGLIDDEGYIGIPGEATIGLDGQWREIIGAAPRPAPRAPQRPAPRPAAKPIASKAPARLSPPGTPAEPTTAPRTDAEFAAYAHRMTGGVHNLLPGWKRFRNFPHLSPDREWVWYGRALYADRHRKSHPKLFPTNAQKLAMARNATALLRATPRIAAPRVAPPRAAPTRVPLRAPVRKPIAGVHGYDFVGALLDGGVDVSAQVVNQATDASGGIWRVLAVAASQWNVYGPGTTTALGNYVRAFLDKNNALRVMEESAAGYRGSVAPTFAPGDMPGGSAASPNPAGDMSGRSGVIVNAIPGEEGQAVGAPLTPEEMAMDAAQPGSNIDPMTGRWVMGTMGVTDDYIMSHPANVTPMGGSAMPGAPGGYMPPDAQPDPNTGLLFSPSTGGYYDPTTGQPFDPNAAYGTPYGAYDPSMMYGAPPSPYGADYAQAMQQAQQQMQDQMDAMMQSQLNAQMDAYLASQTDDGGGDGGLSPEDMAAKMFEEMMASQSDGGDYGGDADSNYDDGSASAGALGTSVYHGVDVGDGLPEGMRDALQKGLFHELHNLSEHALQVPHAKRAQDSILHIEEVWSPREDDVLDPEDLDKLGTALADWKRRYARRSR